MIDYASHDKFGSKVLVENLLGQLVENDYDHEAFYREGYQHSFYYVASFIGEHIDFHAKHLNWYD